MGMYDTVYFDCPSCGERLEEQSKAGSCKLHKYFQSSVPASVADSLIHSILVCGECDSRFTIEGSVPRVSLHLTAVRGEDDDEGWD